MKVAAERLKPKFKILKVIYLFILKCPQFYLLRIYIYFSTSTYNKSHFKINNINKLVKI